MTTRRFWFSAFALVTLLLGAQANTACGFNVAPVYDVQQAAVITASGQPTTTAFVRSVLVRALTHKRWSVVSEQPGVIVATVTSAGSSATIQIDYSATEYSIHHQESSPSMKFDGVKIHKHYNNWIKTLNNAIIKFMGEPDPTAGATAGGDAAGAAGGTVPAGAEQPAPEAAPAQ